MGKQDIDRSNTLPPALRKSKMKKKPVMDRYSIPDVLPGELFHVYVITLRTVGYFYVGVTSDPEKRKATHYARVSLIIKENKERMINEWRQGLSDDPQFKNCKKKNSQSAHNFFAAEIFAFTLGWYCEPRHLDEFLEFKVVATTVSSSDAEDIEEMVIHKAKQLYPSQCLNIQNYSRYFSYSKQR